MKTSFGFHRFLFMVLTAVLLPGCLLKTATVTPRHFVLASIPSNESAPAATGQVSVAIGFVKMPSYLLRDQLAVRNGANEIEYLENALWAERLDQSFQRTLAINVSRLLAAETNNPVNSSRDAITEKVFVTVRQFDVDTRGHGTLIAQWRITAPDNDMRLKIGDACLSRSGASPRGNPQAIATTLSDLVADLSRDLVQFFRDSARPRNESSAAAIR